MINYRGFTPEELGITNELISNKEDIRFYDIRKVPEFTVHGLYDYTAEGCFRRLPEEVAAGVSEAVQRLARHTAGARIRLRTDSSYLAIRSKVKSFTFATAMSPVATSGFDVYIKKNGKDTYLKNLAPFAMPTETPHDFGDGVQAIISLPEGMNEITVNLPYHQQIEEIYIGLDSKSHLEKRADYKHAKPVLYYGSSITQGINASRPGMIYEAIISRDLDCDYLNLGFAGACHGGDVIADYIASLDPSVFVYDYDHNSTKHEHYVATHEALYLKFREAHPDTPVIFVGRPDFWLKGYLNAPLPETNRDVLFETYSKALERGEKVYYIDGYMLLDGEDREECTTDLIHPNDLGMYKMAKSIGRYVDMALNG